MELATLIIVFVALAIIGLLGAQIVSDYERAVQSREYERAFLKLQPYSPERARIQAETARNAARYRAYRKKKERLHD